MTRTHDGAMKSAPETLRIVGDGYAPRAKNDEALLVDYCEIKAGDEVVARLANGSLIYAELAPDGSDHLVSVNDPSVKLADLASVTDVRGVIALCMKRSDAAQWTKGTGLLAC